MKDIQQQYNFGLFCRMMGGCLPFNRLKEPSSQKEVLDKMVSISRFDQERYLKVSLEGGCVQTAYDKEKCKSEFKHISKMEMIKPSNALENDKGEYETKKNK
jgi:hypothetical protein